MGAVELPATSVSLFCSRAVAKLADYCLGCETAFGRDSDRLERALAEIDQPAFVVTRTGAIVEANAAGWCVVATQPGTEVELRAALARCGVDVVGRGDDAGELYLMISAVGLCGALLQPPRGSLWVPIRLHRAPDL
jgi:hypothetical protein